MAEHVTTGEERRTRVTQIAPSAPRVAFQFDPFGANSPVAHEAEAAVIACVLHEPRLFGVVADALQAGDFWTLLWGFVWHACDALYRQGTPIDIISVSQFLDAEGKCPLRGEALVQKLVKVLGRGERPEERHIEEYARMVRDAALRLRVAKAAGEIQELALDAKVDIERVKDEALQSVLRALEMRSEKPTHVRDHARAFYDVVENAPLRSSVPSGFDALDEALAGGFHIGEVTVLAGGAKMGKTTLLLSSIRRMVMRGHRVALFSLEMSAQPDILRALVSIHTGIPRRALKRGDLTPEQWQQFVDAIDDISAWKLHIVDEYKALTPVQLRRKLRMLMMREPIDLVAIDGLWLMDASVPHWREGRHRDVFFIMRDLVAEAAESQVPIVITHQLRTDANWMSPKLADLAESAGVMRNAHVVLAAGREMDAEGRYVAGAPIWVHVLADRNGDGAGARVQLPFHGFGYGEPMPTTLPGLRESRPLQWLKKETP